MIFKSITYFNTGREDIPICPCKVQFTGDRVIKALEFCDIPLTVATSIFEHNIHNKPIWFSELCKVLPLEKHEISHALDTLSDWMIVYHEPGDIGEGRGGYRYYIYDDCYRTIGDIYLKVMSIEV